MKNSYPVLTVRDIVIFPHVVVPLFVGRSRSIKALEAAMDQDKKVIFLSQKNVQDEEPRFDDLYHVGVLGNILQMLNLPDGSVKILVDGIDRVRVSDYREEDGYCSGKCEVLEKENYNEIEVEAYSRMVLEQFEIYSRLNKRISLDTINAVKNLQSPDDIIDVIAAHLTLKVQDKQNLLEDTNILRRFEKLLKFLEAEIDVIHVEKKIRNRVKKQMEKSQKDYYLNNDEANKPNWKDIEGLKELEFPETTRFNDGRKDGKEGDVNGAQTNEENQGLNPDIIENFGAPTLEGGIYKFNGTKNGEWDLYIKDKKQNSLLSTLHFVDDNLVELGNLAGSIGGGSDYPEVEDTLYVEEDWDFEDED